VSQTKRKVVYFLGAGSSAASDYHLPVMSKFFRPEDISNGKHPQLSKFIRQYHKQDRIDQLNLEEIVTSLELACDPFRNFEGPPRAWIIDTKRELDLYIADRLCIEQGRSCGMLTKLFEAGIAGPDSPNSIVTLNYDLSVDFALYQQSPKDEGNPTQITHECLLDRMYNLLGRTELWHGERASLYHRHRQYGYYLKLHGSVDWLFCANPNCGHHELFYPNWMGSPDVHDKPGDICGLCGQPLCMVIVPPTLFKTFEKYPKLGLIWGLAFKELKQADKIVFFGVTFAPSDYYLRWLIRKAIGERESKPVIFDIDLQSQPVEVINTLTGIRSEYCANIDEYLEKAGNNGE
jgi:hypothetical protein